MAIKFNFKGEAAARSRANLSQFARQIEDFKKNSEKELKFVLKKAVEMAFATLTQDSPYPGAVEFKPKASGDVLEPRRSPYSTGAYILSHKIGINMPSMEPPVEKIVTYKTGKDGEKIGSIDLKADKARVMAEFLTKQNAGKVIAQIEAYDTVYITNKNSHAMNVEYGNWNWKGATAPAYHVYEKTASRISQVFQSYINGPYGWAQMAHF